MLFLCVNVYCHRVTTQLQLINIIIIIIIIIITFPLQQWLHERASVFRWQAHCLSC